jgi:serine/threonine protein kinase
MLHAFGLAHHDLSLENSVAWIREGIRDRAVIIDLGMVAKLQCGGGAMVAASKDWPCLSGKSAYHAPETFRCWTDACVPVDLFKLDIWCLGIMLYILITGTSPMNNYKNDYARVDSSVRFFYDEMVVRQKFAVYIGPGGAWKDNIVSANAVDLLSQLLRHNPDDRLSLAQIRKHAWFQMYSQTEALDPPRGALSAPDFPATRVVPSGASAPKTGIVDVIAEVAAVAAPTSAVEVLETEAVVVSAAAAAPVLMVTVRKTEPSGDLPEANLQVSEI